MSFVPPVALRRLLLLVLLLLLLPPLCSAQNDDQHCDDPVSECDAGTDYFPDKVTISHANATIKGINYSNTYVDFTIDDPTDDDASWSYRLVKCGCQPGDVPDGVQVLFTKPSRVLVSEGPSLSLIDELLPNLDPLAYSGDVTYIYNQDVRDRVEEGKTEALPTNPSPNFGTDYSPLKDDDKFSVSIIGVFQVGAYVKQEVGKTFLVIVEAKVISPLARAEWMKVLGMLFDLSKEAGDKFAEIERQYLETKKKAAGAERRPSIFFNSPSLRVQAYEPESSPDINFHWTQPAEKQYITAIVKDANADYRFAFDGEDANKMLSFAEIRGNFSSARFLINTGSFSTPRDDTTLEEFVKDPIVPAAKDDDSFEKLAKELTAVRCGNVWSNQKRVKGFASDYFESAVFKPHVLLTELVHILHPYLDKTQDSDLVYSYHLGDASEDLIGSKCPLAALIGDPPDGKSYVDHTFNVPGLSRFEIEDRADEKILPDLRKKLELDEQSIELFFTKPDDGDSKDTSLTVRVAVNEADVEKYQDSTDMLESLRSTVGQDVSVTNVSGSGTASGDDDEGDGLGGGAIVGIVLAVVVAVAVVTFLVFRSRRRRQRGVGIIGGAEETWEDPDPMGTAQAGTAPMAAA